MKIEPTGVIMVDVCRVQLEKCIAREPASITAVWTLPGRIQVNVCQPCLEEQVRSGQWEIQGAKISRRADVAVYSSDKRLQLVVEVKREPKNIHDSREWATKIHRNLITHSGVPRAPFFLLAALPDDLYLWNDHDRLGYDKPPDFEIKVEMILEPYIRQTSLVLENVSEYQFENLLRLWLTDLTNPNYSPDPSHTWLHESGLLTSVQNGSVVVQAPIAA